MIGFSEKYRNLDGGFKIEDDQIEAINFLLSRPYAVLSLGTGFGKTLIGCTALKILLEAVDNKAKAVIVCPPKAVKIFKKELTTKLFYNKRDIGILTAEDVEFDVLNNKIFIVSHTKIEEYMDLFDEITSAGYKFILVIDEAHMLQDTESQVYKKMANVKNMATGLWALTATPILNDLDSLYNIVNFVCSGFLGKKSKFEKRYIIRHLEDIYIKGGRKKKVWVTDGYQNLEELNSRLNPIIMVRQREYNLKIEEDCKELSEKEYAVYAKVSEGIFGDEERSFSRRIHDLQRLVDSSYNDDGIKTLVEQMGSEITTKEQILIENLKKRLGNGYSVVVYADYLDTIERLEGVIEDNRNNLNVNNIYKITGSVSMRDRGEIEDLISDRDVILITSAGSESINLQKANCVVFYDIPYSVKTSIQVIGRICRRDTKFDYQYINILYTKGTIDEYKYILFKENLDMVRKAIGVGNKLPIDMINVDKKSMAALRDKLLWVYRNKNSKESRKRKKTLRDNIFCASLNEYKALVGTHKFLIEPLVCDDEEVKCVKCLCPNEDKYNSYINGKAPFPILRASYSEFLNSEAGIKYLRKIQEQIIMNGCVLILIGNTELKDLLKECIVNLE